MVIYLLCGAVLMKGVFVLTIKNSVTKINELKK